MRVELLYFDGCPSYRNAEEDLRRVHAEEGVEAEVELVEVNSDEEARRLRFAGSPTLRIDGRDLRRRDSLARRSRVVLGDEK